MITKIFKVKKSKNDFFNRNDESEYILIVCNVKDKRMYLHYLDPLRNLTEDDIYSLYKEEIDEAFGKIQDWGETKGYHLWSY